MIVWAALQLLGWAIGRADWAVLQLNSMLLLVGRYPPEQQWRLWLLGALLAAQAGLSWGLLRAWPRADRRDQGRLWPRHDRIAALLPGRVDVVDRDALRPHLRDQALADLVHAF